VAEISLKVDGMSCGGCEKSITNALTAHDGVSEVKASHEAGTVDISFDDGKIQADALKQAIENAGFELAG